MQATAAVHPSWPELNGQSEDWAGNETSPKVATVVFLEMFVNHYRQCVWSLYDSPTYLPKCTVLKEG